jgi:hypothetical protein
MSRRGRVTLAIVVVLTMAAPAAAAQTVTLEAGEDLTAAAGPTVELQEDLSFSTDNQPDLFPDGQTVDVPGRYAVSADASGGFVEVTDYEAGGFVAGNISTSGTTININPDAGTPVGVAGGVERVEWSDPELGDDQVDVSYTASSTGTLLIYGLPGDFDVTAVAGGQQLDSGTTTDNGVLTLTVPAGTNDIRLRRIQTDRPDLSNAAPVGEQSTAPNELAVTVDDEEFGEGDEVNVTISLDGTVVSQQTITSETRVTTSVSPSASGSHQWQVTATDSFDQTTVQTYQFGVPATFFIRDRTAPDQLVTSTVDVKVTRRNNETILDRTVSDGTLDLSGLPADETLTFVFENVSGYTDRTVLVRQLSQNQSAYLLPDSADAVTVRFTVNDQTGDFDEAQSQLLIKAPLTRNGTTEYRTVVGDRFGAAGVTQKLLQDERYRLVVRNQQNDVYVPGHYRAEINETVQLQVRPTQTDREPDRPFAWSASQVEVQDANDSVVFEYSDPGNETRNLNVFIATRNNGSVVASFDFAGPVGNVTIAEPVPESKEDEGFVVEWDAQREDEDIGARTFVGTGVVVVPALSLFWRQAFSAGVLLLTGAAFSQANAGAGAVSVAILGGLFWFLGWLTGAAAGAVVLALTIASIWKLRQGGVI